MAHLVKCVKYKLKQSDELQTSLPGSCTEFYILMRTSQEEFKSQSVERLAEVPGRLYLVDENFSFAFIRLYKAKACVSAQ